MFLNLNLEIMKKFILLISGLFLFTITTSAKEADDVSTIRNYNGNNFIFNEGGIEFSIYADGQFDFFLPRLRNGVSIGVNTPGVNISFNSGYNYDPYVQYDDYGAVVQIEDIPIFYDYYGRIIQAGDVYISYNNWGRVARVGGLYVNYNRYGHFVNYTGFINPYNRYYVYRPFHAYFTIPIATRCIVYTRPYRRFYDPYRCSYAVYRNNYYNGFYTRGYRDRHYYRPNNRITSYNRGAIVNRSREIAYRDSNSRSRMYRDNDRNVSRVYNTRSRNNNAEGYTKDDRSRNGNGVVNRTRPVERNYNNRDQSANRSRATQGQTQRTERSATSRSRSNTQRKDDRIAENNRYNSRSQRSSNNKTTVPRERVSKERNYDRNVTKGSENRQYKSRGNSSNNRATTDRQTRSNDSKASRSRGNDNSSRSRSRG